jgi:hypothetical protein
VRLETSRSRGFLSRCSPRARRGAREAGGQATVLRQCGERSPRSASRDLAAGLFLEEACCAPSRSGLIARNRQWRTP